MSCIFLEFLYVACKNCKILEDKLAESQKWIIIMHKLIEKHDLLDELHTMEQEEENEEVEAEYEDEEGEEAEDDIPSCPSTKKEEIKEIKSIDYKMYNAIDSASKNDK